MTDERCPGCGGLFPPGEGAGHPYLGASTGCWETYGEVLAREYGDWGLPAVNRLTVDTYAAQHPGAKPTAEAIQSTAVHLVGLYVVLERGFELQKASRLTSEAAAYRSRYRWLEPPDLRTHVTIREILEAGSPQRHEERVWEWARAVWQGWAAHHGTVREWANLVLSRA